MRLIAIVKIRISRDLQRQLLLLQVPFIISSGKMKIFQTENRSFGNKEKMGASPKLFSSHDTINGFILVFILWLLYVLYHIGCHEMTFVKQKRLIKSK